MSRETPYDGPQGNVPELSSAGRQRKQGIRTHVLLVLVMALVTMIVTGVSLFLVRNQLRREVTDHLSEDLNRSVTGFEDMEAERLAALDRENALLADLPTLKALMTSGDDITIQDEAVEFWEISGDDLFALADPRGRIVAAYTKGSSTPAALDQELQTLLASPQRHYLIDGRSLYACSLRPLYFGSEEHGTLLGYVISGTSIERTVRQIGQPNGLEAAFLSDGKIVASTLSPATQASLAAQAFSSGGPRTPTAVTLGKSRFLAATEDLSHTATAPLHLIVLKSFEPVEQSISHIDRMVLSVGAFALFSGSILMMLLGGILTRPLEELSMTVRAFGEGNRNYRIPKHGTREVRQLSEAFSAMRDEIQQANRAVLEAERLATIGRMASSISHDFRHYLAAIYANAEFLASSRLSAKESAEIFADIRTAVLGTTEMIESLLIFSRTGTSIKKAPELMTTVLEKALATMRAHPDARNVDIVAQYPEPAETAIIMDGKQIERAIFNLLLNACQTLRAQGIEPKVSITLEAQEQFMIVNVIDNGVGVPGNIRNSLFQPFVSEGKQKGTGLGLTLVHCIATDHGGEALLLSSRPGETIFQMKVARLWPGQDAPPVSDSEHHDQVLSHGNVPI